MISRISYLLSLIVFAGGLAWVAQTAWQLRTARHATGTIVKVDRDVGDTGAIFWPSFEFTDAQGAIHVRRFTVGVASEEAFRVGDRVDVLYPAGEPGKARVDDWIQHWLKPLLLALLGGIGFWVTRIANTANRAQRR